MQKQYHDLDTVAVFFIKDKLQLHMHIANSFKGKDFIPNALLNTNLVSTAAIKQDHPNKPQCFSPDRWKQNGKELRKTCI